MKKTLVLLLFSILLITACSSEQMNEDSQYSGPAYGFFSIEKIESLDRLYQESGSIVEVRKTGKVEDIYNQDVALTLTEFNVIQVIHGDQVTEGEKIRIVDLKPASISLDKETDYLLFLNPKAGTYGDDVFSIVGNYQGKFKIIDNKLVYDADKFGGLKAFQDILSDQKVSRAIEQIRQKVNEAE